MDQLRFCTNPKCLQLYKELRRPRRVEAVKHSQKDIPKIPPYHRDCAVLLQKSELRGEEWIRFSNFLEGRRVDVRMSFEWEKWGACQIAQTLAGSQLLTKKCLLSSSSNFPSSKRLSVNFASRANYSSRQEACCILFYSITSRPQNSYTSMGCVFYLLPKWRSSDFRLFVPKADLLNEIPLLPIFCSLFLFLFFRWIRKEAKHVESAPRKEATTVSLANETRLQRRPIQQKNREQTDHEFRR